MDYNDLLTDEEPSFEALAALRARALRKPPGSFAAESESQPPIIPPGEGVVGKGWMGSDKGSQADRLANWLSRNWDRPEGPDPTKFSPGLQKALGTNQFADVDSGVTSNAGTPPAGPQVPPQAPAAPPPPPRALPKAVGGPSTTSTSSTSVPVTPPPSNADQTAQQPGGDLYERRRKLEEQLAEAEKQPDYSALKQEAIDRQMEGGNALKMALLASYAQKEPFSAHYLKRASELQSPIKVEGGYINASGDPVIDPGYKRQQNLAMLQRRMSTLDQLIATAENKAQEMAYRKAKDEADRELRKMQMEMMAESRRMTAAIAQGNLDLRREIAGVGQGGGAFDALPKQATAEEKNSYAKAAAALKAFPEIKALASKYPNAFGFVPGSAEAAGGMVGMGGNQVLSKVPLAHDLTKDEQVARARIYKHYAQVIHDLIGAAQTEGEKQNLRSFIPGIREDLPSILAKVDAAQAEAARQHATLRQRYGMGVQVGTQQNPAQSDL